MLVYNILILWIIFLIINCKRKFIRFNNILQEKGLKAKFFLWIKTFYVNIYICTLATQGENIIKKISIQEKKKIYVNSTPLVNYTV